MKNLIELIKEQFIKSNYSLVESHDLLYKSNNFTDYWLIRFQDGDYNIEELQESLFNGLSTLIKESPCIEKNTNLLIINRVDIINRTKIIQDENNEFYFKKYILQYTDNQWNSLELLIKNNKNLENLLTNSDIFDRLKNNCDQGAVLLYSIAHKLPFITIVQNNHSPYLNNQLSENITQTAEYNFLNNKEFPEQIDEDKFSKEDLNKITKMLYSKFED